MLTLHIEGWSKNDDAELLKLLDELNDRGVKFALSNVIEHKGLKNEELIKWMEKYKTHYINFNYKNSSYHGKNTNIKQITVVFIYIVSITTYISRII